MPRERDAIVLVYIKTALGISGFTMKRIQGAKGKRGNGPGDVLDHRVGGKISFSKGKTEPFLSSVERSIRGRSSYKEKF